MQRKIAAIQRTLREFGDQRRDLTMIVKARDSDIPLLAKLAERTQQERLDDLVLVFAHPVEGASSYVTLIVEQIRAQVEELRATGLPDGIAPPGPLPISVLDPATAPTRRLQELSTYLRGCTPTDDGRVVLMLLPAAIRDAAAWAEIVSGLFLRGDVEPWMSRVRFILRDDPGEPILVPLVDRHQLGGTRIYEVDFRTKAMIDALANSARDASLPRPERMMAILQLAGLDFSYGRLEEALAKYGALHTYFVESDNPACQAYCLQGAGDTLRRLGRAPEAQIRYQQGMAVAFQRKVPGVALSIAMALGDLHADANAPLEAQRWYVLGDELARLMANGIARCDLAEKMGAAQLAMRDYGGAAATWQRGADLAREQRYFTRWAAILDRLSLLYREARMAEQAGASETAAAQVRALLARGHQNCSCGVFA